MITSTLSIPTHRPTHPLVGVGRPVGWRMTRLAVGTGSHTIPPIPLLAALQEQSHPYATVLIELRGIV